MYTCDYDLFLWLNFDGGPIMDKAMLLASKPLTWIGVYLLMLYIIYRRHSWRGVLIFLLAAALAMGVADIVSGIFKHSGLLGDLWTSFPARPRPMHTPALQDKIHVLTSGGQYGTVSGHAATLTAITLLSSLAIRRRWFVWMMVAVAITVCYSRIYLAYHFPIDIALGVATGLLSGATGWFFYKWSIKRWCK